MSDLRRVDPKTIQVGDRYREDDAEPVGLRRSVEALGMLNPIIVSTDMWLIAGGRRLKAALASGVKWIEIKVVNTPDPRGLELAENIERKPFTNYELCEAATDRVAYHGGPTGAGKIPDGVIAKVAAELGIGPAKTERLLIMFRRLREKPDYYAQVGQMLRDPETALNACYERCKLLAGEESDDKGDRPQKPASGRLKKKEPPPVPEARPDPAAVVVAQTTPEAQPEPETGPEQTAADPPPKARPTTPKGTDTQTPMLDPFGVRVPDKIRDLWAFKTTSGVFVKAVMNISNAMRSAYGENLDWIEFESAAGEFIRQISDAEPHAVCRCRGYCDDCRGNGYLTLPAWNEKNDRLNDIPI